MNRITALLLTLCIALSMFAGCSGSSNPQTPSVDTSTPETTDNVATTAVPIATTVPPTGAPKTTIPESIIFESDDVKITTTGLDDGDYGGKEIKFLVENYSDRNIAFSGTYFVVNGIMLPCWLYIDVAPGKKANGALEINGDNMAIAQITDIATVVAYDAAIVDTDSFDTLAEIPFSLESSIAEVYTQELDETGKVVYEQDGITIVAQYLYETFSGYEVQVLIQNNTDRDLSASTFSVSVNGFTIDAWMYEIIPSGTSCYGSFSFSTEDLEENGIETVEEVSFFLDFIDPNTYDTVLSTEELQVSFSVE